MSLTSTRANLPGVEYRKGKENEGRSGATAGGREGDVRREQEEDEGTAVKSRRGDETREKDV